jgi:hypothetical protein
VKREQQKPGGAKPNLLILWHRGSINSKIAHKNIGLWLPDDPLGLETPQHHPDFAITCRIDPRLAAALGDELAGANIRAY